MWWSFTHPHFVFVRPAWAMTRRERGAHPLPPSRLFLVIVLAGWTDPAL